MEGHKSLKKVTGNKIQNAITVHCAGGLRAPSAKRRKEGVE